jgi:hypothetical protein
MSNVFVEPRPKASRTEARSPTSSSKTRSRITGGRSSPVLKDCDQDYLLYPLDTGKPPICPGCSKTMVLAMAEVREGKPDFMTFRCNHCGRSERLVCEE